MKGDDDPDIYIYKFFNTIDFVFMWLYKVGNTRYKIDMIIIKLLIQFITHMVI